MIILIVVTMPIETPYRETRLHWLKNLWKLKYAFTVLLTPLLLMPIPFLYESVDERGQGKCLYVFLIMAVYWVTVSVPLAITSLIPIALFPLFTIQKSDEVCKNYFKDSICFLFGSMMFTLAIEKWNLHKRFALAVLLMTGVQPLWITFGLMCVTAFLSFWFNNTTTTAFMLPIAHAVLDALNSSRILKLYQGNASESETAESDKTFKAFMIAVKLCIPYSSSIGGTGTLIGSPVNIAMLTHLKSYPDGMNDMTFGTWMVIALPALVVELAGTWMIIMIVNLGPKRTFSCRRDKDGESTEVKHVVYTEYNKLGTFSFPEGVVLVCFVTMLCIWLTRSIYNWQVDEYGSFVTDASIGITFCVLLFILPSRRPNYLFFRKIADDSEPRPSPALLDWTSVYRGMEWSAIIMLGGAFALSDGIIVSKLSDDITDFFKNELTPDHIVLILTGAAMLVTIICSNVATLVIFLPIAKSLACDGRVNSVYIVTGLTLASSIGFMLPCSSMSNALTHSYGDLSIRDMAKTGAIVTLFTYSIVLISMFTYIRAFVGTKIDPPPNLCNYVASSISTSGGTTNSTY